MRNSGHTICSILYICTVIGRLRHMTFVAWLVLAVLSIVGGGQHVVHYTFAHQEAHHLYENDCCKPDHRLPHFHEAKYCALCDIDVSVVLHQDAFQVQQVSRALVATDLVTYTPSPTLQATACITLRGPPATA